MMKTDVSLVSCVLCVTVSYVDWWMKLLRVGNGLVLVAVGSHV